MKREWMLYFAASAALLTLYIAPRFALNRRTAGEAAQADPLAVVTACTLVSILTLLFTTLASRNWRYGPVIGSRGGQVFTAITVVSIWGAALADQSTPLAQIYTIPELFITLVYRRVLTVAAVMSFDLVTVQALSRESTSDNLSKWAVATIATVVLTGLSGKPINLLTKTNMRNRKFVEQLQARGAQIARLSHLEGAVRKRERVARGVHDTIAQGLASILALARAAAAEVAQMDSAGPSAMGVTRAGNAAASANGAGVNHQMSRHLVMIVEFAQEGLNDTRRMIADISPRALDERGLAEVVGRAADRLGRERVTVTRSLDSTLPPLPQSARVAILRIAQEAIANVTRHSWIANAAVSFRFVARMAVLEVRDDGVGFDPATASAVDTEGGGSSNQAVLRGRPESADEGRADLTRVRRAWQRGRLGRAPEGDDSGFGTPDICGRATDLGGNVNIDSSPGSGTRVLAQIPVEAPAMEDAASAEGPTSQETASQTSQEATDSALQGKEKE